MPPKTLKLSAGQLAQIFNQLHRLEAAGLPCHSSFSMLLHSETNLRKPLLFMQQQLSYGQPVSQAGFKAGIFNEALKTLIHAAEESGRLTEVYGQLADYYSGLASRIKKVKSRLYLPVLVLTLSLFIHPLPALISSSISLTQYLLLSLGQLFVIGLSAFLLIKLPGILRSLGAEAGWHRLQLRVPAVKNWILRRQLNEFFFVLAMMSESGLPFSEALPKAVDSIKNSRLREAFYPALALLNSGASAANMLAQVPVINRTAIQIIDSSEHSGKLASGLQHFTRLEAETISRQDDALAEWLPRMIYCLVAAWMAYSILGGQFATVVPKDL